VALSLLDPLTRKKAGSAHEGMAILVTRRREKQKKG